MWLLWALDAWFFFVNLSVLSVFAQSSTRLPPPDKMNIFLSEDTCIFKKEQVLLLLGINFKADLKKGILMNKLEIKQMSIVERLQAIEALWDSLLEQDIEIESPQWHQEVLNERKGRIESGEAGFITLSELKSRRNE